MSPCLFHPNYCDETTETFGGQRKRNFCVQSGLVSPLLPTSVFPLARHRTHVDSLLCATSWKTCSLGALTPEILENQQLNLQAQKALMDTWDDQYASFMVLDCANIWMRSNTLLEKLRNYAAFAKRFTV